MTARIVYTRPDGGVAICAPSPDLIAWMGCGGLCGYRQASQRPRPSVRLQKVVAPMPYGVSFAPFFTAGAPPQKRWRSSGIAIVVISVPVMSFGARETSQLIAGFVMLG
jgi:hypothetical protein